MIEKSRINSASIIISHVYDDKCIYYVVEDHIYDFLISRNIIIESYWMEISITMNIMSVTMASNYKMVNFTHSSDCYLVGNSDDLIELKLML